MKNFYVILIAAISMLGYSCSKGDRLDHYDSDAPAPAQVTNLKAVSKAGGAVLSYKLPSDPNLAYVKAVYEIQKGVFREARASIFADTLSLVGFGDTNPHEVKVYSVGKNEKQSEPVSYSITPLIAPVITTFTSLDLSATFGGVTVSFENPSKSNISIEILVDSTGKNLWSTVTTSYTASASGKFAVRGLKSVDRRYGVLVRDRWNNKSDTLIRLLKPKFEVQIPKTLWKNLALPTDTYLPAAAVYPIEKLWDGKWATLTTDCFASPNASTLPQWFTIDLGQKVLLSRFKEHQAATSHLYVGSAVKKFEIWGSNNPPADGSFNNWDLLGTFNSYKPSGAALGSTSAEDKNYANFLGEDFDFINQPIAYRYIRFKSLETYSSTGQIVIAEITLFGEVQ